MSKDHDPGASAEPEAETPLVWSANGRPAVPQLIIDHAAEAGASRFEAVLTTYNTDQPDVMSAAVLCRCVCPRCATANTAMMLSALVDFAIHFQVDILGIIAGVLSQANRQYAPAPPGTRVN